MNNTSTIPQRYGRGRVAKNNCDIENLLGNCISCPCYGLTTIFAFFQWNFNFISYFFAFTLLIFYNLTRKKSMDYWNHFLKVHLHALKMQNSNFYNYKFAYFPYLNNLWVAIEKKLVSGKHKIIWLRVFFQENFSLLFLYTYKK